MHNLGDRRKRTHSTRASDFFVERSRTTLSFITVPLLRQFTLVKATLVFMAGGDYHGSLWFDPHPITSAFQHKYALIASWLPSSTASFIKGPELKVNG
jgi:hypothetical protein